MQAISSNIESLDHPNSIADALCLRLIKFYKKEISPHKGYSCPGRILGELMHDPKAHSCSTHAVMLIKEFGVRRAIPKMKERFGECKLAAIQLNELRKKFNGMSADQLKTMNLHLMDPQIIQHATNLAANCQHSISGCHSPDALQHITNYLTVSSGNDPAGRHFFQWLHGACYNNDVNSCGFCRFMWNDKVDSIMPPNAPEKNCMPLVMLGGGVTLLTLGVTIITGGKCFGNPREKEKPPTKAP
jgi:putative component of membrane protein insertase Oxa1/YidC/SpoIIIJ protein YidD